MLTQNRKTEIEKRLYSVYEDLCDEPVVVDRSEEAWWDGFWAGTSLLAGAAVLSVVVFVFIHVATH